MKTWGLSIMATLLSFSTAGGPVTIARRCLSILLIFLVIDCPLGQPELKSNRNAPATTSRQIYSRQEPQPSVDLQQDSPELRRQCNTSRHQCDQENGPLSWELISGNKEIRRLNATTRTTTTGRPELVKSRHVPPQIATTTTTTSRPSTQSSLITRTTDAIYRALSGYFSHDDDDEQADEELANTSSPLGSDSRIKNKPAIPTSTPLHQPNSTAKTSDTNEASATTTLPPTIKTKSKPTQATRSTPSPQPNQANRVPTTALPTLEPSSLRPIASTTSTRPAKRTSPTTTPTQTALTSELPAIITSTTIKKVIGGRLANESTESTIQPHLDLNLYQDEPELSPSSPTKITSATTTTTSTTSKSISPVKRKNTKSKSTTTTPTTTTTTTTTERPTTISELRTTTLSPSKKDSSWLDIGPNRTATSATSGKVVDGAGDSSKKGQLENSIEFFSFLKKAINSIYSFKEFTYLNRTTRLVHETGELRQADSGVSNLLPSGNESGGGGEREETFEDEARSSNVDEGNVSSGQSAGGNQAGVQKQKLQQVTTRDEIMLLCKLLHKQLENGSIITTANGTLVLANNGTGLLASSPPSHHSDKQQKSVTPTAATTTTTTTTMMPVRARDLLEEFVASGMHIRDPHNDLNETHENRLLESTFALERRVANEASYEEAAQSLLADLYNAAFRQKFHISLTKSSRQAGADNSSSSSSTSVPVSNERESTPLYVLNMRLWSKTITGGRGGSLRLVYWLILHAASSNVGVQTSSPASYKSTADAPIRFRVLDADEASDLMDVLDHSIIQQAIDNSRLIRPIVLVAPYRRSVRVQNGADQPAVAGDDADFSPVTASPSPHVIDDTLAGPNGGNHHNNGSSQNQAANSKPSSMQVFVDKFFKSSLNDNLYLYLVLFIIAFFLIVLCFAIPAICSKLLYSRTGNGNMTPAPTATTTTGRLSGSGNGSNSSSHYSGPHHGKRTRHGSHSGGEGHSRRAAHATRYPASTGAEQKGGAIASVSGALDHRRDDRSCQEDDYDRDDARSRGISGTINEAVWTKLSNSTTTLTKDQTRTMYDDGQVCVPILRHSQESLDREQLEREKLKRYEWYTFEDKTTTTTIARRNNNGVAARDKRSQTFTLDDHYKATKSVQTNEGRDDENDQAATLRAGEQGLMNMNMSFRDRIETRNSDTLTKSELVMIKEKLIPICRQKGAAFVDSLPSGAANVAGLADQRPSHDYVNTTVASGQQNDLKLTKYIDLSADDSAEAIQTWATSGPTQMSTGGGSLESGPSKQGTGSSDRAGRSSAGLEQAANMDQRTPKMRYLELPKKAQVKVDEIKGELSRLEERDSVNQKQSMSGTYKRYDVI